MWGTAVVINGIIWSIASVYLIYAACNLIIHLEWKQFVITAIIWIAISFAEIVFSALAE